MINDKGREELLRAFQKKMGYQFKKPELLDEALTHSSYANENGTTYNEKLEFLGDAVLELITTEKLYLSLPDCGEGALTRLRAQLVCKESLYELAKRLDLRQYLRVGKSLIKTGPTPSNAADCVEAIIGAIFLDGGMEEAKKLVLPFLAQSPELSGTPVTKDPKTRLQEHYQKLGLDIPEYRTVERAGPDHALRFHVKLFSGRRKLAEAWGPSIREAEVKAAATAMKAIEAAAAEQEPPSEK